jgi:hypothetical protein
MSEQEEDTGEVTIVFPTNPLRSAWAQAWDRVPDGYELMSYIEHEGELAITYRKRRVEL